MNSAENYKEAERLRECARDADVDPRGFDWRTYFNQAAQVHATLALVDGSTSARQRQRIEALCEDAEDRHDWVSSSALRAALEES
jgi:hypothetical protein